MFGNRTFGTRDAELQSTLMTLHDCRYRGHEDVLAILLHDDFRGDALRGEYYATSYLRHRLPLLFRLALCKWRPHRRAKKTPQGLRNKKRGVSASSSSSAVADGLSGHGASHHSSSSETVPIDDESEGKERCGASGSGTGLGDVPSGRAAEGNDSAFHGANTRRPGSRDHLSPALPSESRRGFHSGDGGQWETQHRGGSTTPTSSTPTTPTPAETRSASAPAKEESLTPEQQTRLSILALQVLCGDRSRVREGSSEAATAACGPVWDAHTVRDFYESHRRLVRWTCRVLRASCEWVEDVVRRAVDDELLAVAPPSVTSPVDDLSANASSGCEDGRLASMDDVVAQEAPSRTFSFTEVPTQAQQRRGRTSRALSAEARPRQPASTDYSAQPSLVSERATAAEAGPCPRSIAHAPSEAGSELPPHFGHYRRSPYSTPAVAHHQHHQQQQQQQQPQQHHLHSLLSKRPPPPHAVVVPSKHPLVDADVCSEAANASALPPPHPSSLSHNARRTFTSTGDLEVALQLHCRRIRHALMVLESLLVSLVMVQSYIYRAKPGRSSTPPWLRRRSSSSSGSEDFSDSDDDDEDGSEEDAEHEDYGDGGERVGGGPRKSGRRRHRHTSANGGLRHSIYEYRLDSSSSFETDDGGDEGHTEEYAMQMEAEADEPPLDLLVRHCLHAYTQTFLSITAVQQQLQDYSHESRHAAAASPSSASTATTTAAAIHRSFAATSPLPSSEHGGASRLFPLCAVNRQPSGNANSSIAERGSSSAVSPTTPMTAVESEAGSLVAARGTPAAYACARCQRFHQVEEVLLVAANDNLEVLKKAAIAFAAHHSAIAEESIRVIDAEGAVFTSQATMLLAHVLTPEVLAAHPPGSRGGMALEWVLNYVFGGCSGADVRQHQQQQQKQHTAATADVNSSFDCFSLANSSFSSTNPHSVDTGDADGRSSDGGWRTAGGGAAENSESGGSSVPSSSGRWNVNRFEYGDDVAIDGSLHARRNGSDGHHNGHHNDDSSGSNTTDESDGETPQQAAAQDQREERQATNLRVEYILAACFTRCHPLMTVIGCVAENNQYNCGRTVAQAVLQYAFTLSQTSARLLRTPLLTGTWSTPFTEAMMRGLSELAAHVHQSVAVTPSLAQPGSGAAANLTCSFASSSATAALNRGVTPAQLIKSTNGSFAPFLVAQLQVPASLVSSAMRRVPRPRPYAFIPPPAAVVSGASPADESEAAQVRTMRRCLALHWAKCVLLSARTLTRAGTYDVPVPFEHYLNIRTARVQMRGRMMEYRDRMRAHFVAAGDHAKVKRLDETFERWEADERRMDEHDRDIVEDTNGSFTTATAPYTMQGTPATPGLYTVDPFGRVSPAPVAEGREAAADAVAAGQSHFDSHHTAHTLTANVATFASPAGTVAPRPDGSRDPQSLLLLPEVTDDSSPGSIGADPLGRSFSGTATTEKESYRRAFVDSFCFGKSDLELLSAALLGKSRTAVPVPIHVIVCTSLFSILDAMGDVLLCEKPRLNSVVANELMTLMYEAQLSMLEPLHDGAMAVVERTGASTPTTTTTSAASSLSNSFPRMEPFSQALEQLRSVSSRKSDTSDSFVSPGSSRLPSTAASSASSVTVSSGDDDEEGEEAEDAGGHDGTERGGGGGGRTLFLKRCAERQFGGADAVDAAGEQQGSFNDSFASSNSGDDDRSADGDEEGISGSGGTGGGSADGDVALQSFGSHRRAQDRRKTKKKKKRSAHATRMDSTTLARDGHILLFNEYALLLEAGLRSPLVVRRWREDVRANPDHAARGYLSLLDHLQYRQSQWAEPSQEEYLISRSTLRLMLGVTARDARGNMHGNILHVDDLDVLGSRKEEVAPRLGVTSSKDSLTTLFSDEWDPTTVEAVEDPTPRSSGAVAVAAAAGEGSTEAVVAATRSSADQLVPLQPSLRPPQFPPPCGASADSMPQCVGSTEAMAAQAVVSERREGAGRPPLSGQLLAAAPLTGQARLLGPRTSSFECVSLLGTRLETGDDDEEDDDDDARGGRKAGSSVGRHVSVRELLHQHHHDRVHQHFIDADDTSLNSSDDSDGDHRPLPPVNRHAAYAQGGDDEGLGEGPDNSSFVSAGSFHSEDDGEEHHLAGQEEAGDERPADAAAAAAATTRAPSSLASAQDAEHATLAAEKGVGSLRGSRHGGHAERSPSHGQGLAVRGGTPAPWKHQPTRVTLAGAGAELDTMVRRMPYTWTLASPLPDGAGTQTERGDRTLSPQPSLSHPQSPVPEAGERGADVDGRDVATASAAVEGGSPPAMPLRVDTVVHYAPVVVAASPGAETTVSTGEEEEEEEEDHAVKAGDVDASIGGDYDKEEADGQAEAEVKDEERGELSREESARSVNPLDAVAGNLAASDAEESADADPPTSAEPCPLKDAEHTDGVERDTVWPDAASDAVLLSLGAAAAADVPTSEVDASVPLKSASQPAWMRPLVSPVPELASQTDAVAALLTRRVPACLSGQASPANSLSPSSSSNRIDMEGSEGAAAAEEREEEEEETRSTQPDTEYLRGYGRGPLALSPRCDGLGDDDDMHNDSGSDYCEIDESRLLSAAPRPVPPAAHAAQAAAASSSSLLLSPPQEQQQHQQQPLASPSVPSVSLRSSAASSTASLPAVEDEGEAVSPVAAHITVASQRPVYRVTVVEPLTCDGTNSAPRRRATTPQTQSPFSLSRGLGSAKADSAPLSLDASPVNDVALSRAIHRVLSHRRSLPSSSSSPILSSAGSMSETTRGGGGGGQSLSEPVSPASRSPASGSPAGGVGAVARDPAAAVGAAAAMATPNVSPNNTASRRRQQQQHSREAWTETLTQLKLTATVAEAATTPTTAGAGPEDGQRSPHSTRRESTAGDEGPSRRRSSRGSPGLSLLDQSKGAEGAVTDAAAAKTTNVVEGRLSDQREKKRVVNDEGPAVEPAPTQTAAAAHTLPSLTATASSSSPTTTATTTAGGRSSSSCLDAADAASRGSNDSFTSTSPNASHSAPHDLQWYTGANARSSALRPPRSTVSTDGPMSPISAFPYRFPVVEEEGLSNSGNSPAGGALALPTGAEGVSSNVRIGQGVGKSRQWFAGAAAVGGGGGSRSTAAAAHSSASRTSAQPQQPLQQSLSGARTEDGRQRTVDGGVVAASSASTHASSAAADRESLPANAVRTLPEVHHSSGSVPAHERGSGGSAYSRAGRFSHAPSAATAGATNTASAARGGGGGAAWPTDGEGTAAAPHPPPPPASAAATALSSSPGGRPRAELSDSRSTWAAKGHVGGGSEPMRVAVTLPPESTPTANTHSDSPLNSRYAGATGYASSNDSDVST